MLAVLGATACADSASRPGGGDSGTRPATFDPGTDPATDGTSPTDTPTDTPSVVPLFDATSELERPVLEDVGYALITRFGDRGRDRHAREDVFAAYDHYLSHYWEHRTVSVEIVDTVGRDPSGGELTFNVTSQFEFHPLQAELRFFYRGLNTVAEYHDNGVMTEIGDLLYTRSVSVHGATAQPLQVGDEMEFELSQFLDGSVESIGGRANYYGTAYLYVVGVGLVPWQANTTLGTDVCPCDGEISTPVPEMGWLGGLTTLPYQYSNEPTDHLMQMATNLAGDNAQPFVRGRRLVHTDFGDGTHSESSDSGESVDNPIFAEQSGKLGPHYVNASCDACHVQNRRALPPEVGTPLAQYVFRIGDSQGLPTSDRGSVLQTGDALGAAEGSVEIAQWIEEDGLRRPVYTFTGATPDTFSARIAPPLVGMGLLEAIPEDEILALADPSDADGDGISGRIRAVVDPITGDVRLGRFGYKAGQATVAYQVAGALNTDMGVMTSVFPDPDCGVDQAGCEPPGAELDDADLADLAAYVSLLGMRPRRSLDDSTALHGEALFEIVGCADCHITTYRTSVYSRHAELRDQTIHPYTDLLLHDMGPGLADTLAEGDASGAEWRTAPLWNIGLTAELNGGEAYLHDGRARTLDEAIRWHGGEGQAATDAYLALPQPDQDALVAFLKSL